MAKLLEIIANGSGLLGVLICLVAGVTRILGSYHVLGFEAITLFIGGIALMVMACLIKLHQLTAD
jgi:hypothetical protein